MTTILLLKVGDTFPEIKAIHGDYETMLEACLPDDQVAIQLYDPRQLADLPDLAQVDGVIITGSHSMMTDEAPWSERLLPYIREMHQREVPVLGICFGHQLIAKSLGGTVDYHQGGIEPGTITVHLSEAGQQDPLLGQLPPSFIANSGHSQTVSILPKQAVLLAGNDFEPHESFRVGKCVWGVQFHPEFTQAVIREYIDFYQEAVEATGVSAQLVSEACAETPESRSLIGRFIELVRSQQTQPVLENADTGAGYLSLKWSDGKASNYHYLWLRDNCLSTLHPETQERIFDQLSVSADIHPLHYAIQNDQLLIEWSEQNHHSIFEGQWLREHAYSGDLRAPNKPSAKSWDNTFLNDISSAKYTDLMTDDRALYQWMKQLNQDGLILVKHTPSTPQALDEISGRIDYQRQTNFGVTFEVRSEANPINLAYTSLALPLHTDLPNQEMPPGYQFLHCLENDSDGGESVFADGLKVLEGLRDESPEYFELLASHSIPFRFHDDEHDICHHHPVINLDHQGNIIELKYNAHIASTFDLPEKVMHDYYLAYRDLMTRLRAERYRIQFKLTAGVMVVFDNRRVLHGRMAFEPNGNRHLRGCYVDRTEFQSRLRVLGYVDFIGSGGGEV